MTDIAEWIEKRKEPVLPLLKHYPHVCVAVKRPAPAPMYRKDDNTTATKAPAEIKVTLIIRELMTIINAQQLERAACDRRIGGVGGGFGICVRNEYRCFCPR